MYDIKMFFCNVILPDINSQNSGHFSLLKLNIKEIHKVIKNRYTFLCACSSRERAEI